MSTLVVFPGWPEIRNQKWLRDPKAERAVQRSEAHLELEMFFRVYRSPLEGLTAFISWEPGMGWHLSLSHQRREPVWAEVRDTRYDLLPDEVTMGMLLPPKAEYINVHPYCFHLHQVPGDGERATAP